MNKLLSALCFIALLTACATHRGTISSSSICRPVKYVDIALGVSQSNRILGLGGIAQDALLLEAKREMIKYRPLG